ncbi:GNAT family N-acetyltransferase [Saccharopolyspora sp. NPDC047091]|uniref:GNAT family N-acetyltransferase n=1 Tax=Saccharopolyspora sp. NPDC047091 TaxID=3155924 RepID=UPI0033C0054D
MSPVERPADPVISLDRAADLSAPELAELTALRHAVYPPADEADWAGADLEWAGAHWRVRVRAPDGSLVCNVSLLVRTGAEAGREVTIAGVGGVQTHPGYRRRGYAHAALRASEAHFRSRGDVDFGLLVCDPPLLRYYAELGWREFTGTLLVTRFGEPTEFVLSPVMTLPVGGAAPVDGVIDLGGPPW